jgi:hypothetical protein
LSSNVKEIEDDKEQDVKIWHWRIPRREKKVETNRKWLQRGRQG